MLTLTARYTLLALFLFLGVFVCGNSDDEGDVIVLNDDNFEHLTQAATGATTGDWLVLMTTDEKCKDCDKIEKQLRKVAFAFQGRKNVAKLDPSNSRLTLRRFKITKKPVLLFFHQGYQWNYKGDLKHKKIEEFIGEGFQRKEAWRVAGQLDSIDVWKEDFMTELKAAYKEKRLPKLSVLLTSLLLIAVGSLILASFVVPKKKEEGEEKDYKSKSKSKKNR